MQSDPGNQIHDDDIYVDSGGASLDSDSILSIG